MQKDMIKTPINTVPKAMKFAIGLMAIASFYSAFILLKASGALLSLGYVSLSIGAVASLVLLAIIYFEKKITDISHLKRIRKGLMVLAFVVVIVLSLFAGLMIDFCFKAAVSQPDRVNVFYFMGGVVSLFPSLVSFLFINNLKKINALIELHEGSSEGEDE